MYISVQKKKMIHFIYIYVDIHVCIDRYDTKVLAKFTGARQKVLSTLAKVLNSLAKVIIAWEKSSVLNSPAKVLKTPAKVLSNPAKVIRARQQS
jgi:hypothetical protein